MKQTNQHFGHLCHAMQWPNLVNVQNTLIVFAKFDHSKALHVQQNADAIDSLPRNIWSLLYSDSVKLIAVIHFLVRIFTFGFVV